MATDEGFASSSALALVLGSRRDGEAEKGGRLAELLGEEERVGEGGRRKECGRGLLCGGLVGFNRDENGSAGHISSILYLFLYFCPDSDLNTDSVNYHDWISTS